MSHQWIFEPEPASGARRGGSASEHAFSGQIDTLVREVVQNSLDARDDPRQPVRVVFKLVVLDGDSLAEFQTAIGWDHVLDNLDDASTQRGGELIKTALEQVGTGESLCLLVVEDYNTHGLTGAEHRSDSPDQNNNFCALIKDELYSDKAGEGSGGSFGLGKALLWAYSSLKMVFFASSLKELPSGGENPRVIGRCSLPWHETKDDGPCDGNGWFGSPQERKATKGKRQFAGSVWGESASDLAGQLFCNRGPTDLGLSAVIVGFSEPGEEDREPGDVIKAIADKTRESFWPALASKNLEVAVRIQHNDEIQSESNVTLTGSPYEQLAEMLDAWKSGTAISSAPSSTSEVVAVDVPLRVPKKENGEVPHEEYEAKVTLLVRLLDEEFAAKEIKDRIFAFRGPGMVVRSNQRSNLSITARPYAAALVCGAARSDNDDDIRADAFLKAAEPPAHDVWTHSTRALKKFYVTYGCKARLDEFDYAVRDAIRRIVSVPEEPGGSPPEQMRKHLRFGEKGGGGHKRFASVSKGKASLNDEGAWEFESSCRRIQKSDKPWEVIVKLKFGSDGAPGDLARCIKTISPGDSDCKVEIDGGSAVIAVPANKNTCSFTGQTDPDLHPVGGDRAILKLIVDARNTKGG